MVGKYVNRTLFMQLVLVAWAVILPIRTLANDGIYQGSGSTLTMVKNSHVRVHEEHLSIAPIYPPLCYSVLINGKPIKDGMDIDPIRKSANITVGPRVECSDTDDLRARWRAVAEYQVVASRTQNNVLIGFPIDTWTRDFKDNHGDLGRLDAPGVANFRTFINGEEMEHLTLKRLGSDLTGSKPNEKTSLGYTWRASFLAGKRYYLRTEYDFGMRNSNSFYEGREYLPGETPWFWEGKYAADGFFYALTPLNSWGSPPPERIKIVVKLPPGVPVTHVVPMELKPSCITTNTLHYEIGNQFPSQDLVLNMPAIEYLQKVGYERLHTIKQWREWQKTLGGAAVKIGCDVIKELKAGADPDLQAQMNDMQCVSSC